MKSFHVQSANAAVRYHDLPGDESPILFIHGLGCTSSFDYPQVAAAASLSKHRCILIDMLGSGYSDKPADFAYSIETHAEYLAELVLHLGPQKFFIFGHSMGGAVAIALASKCKEQLKGLILGESNLDPGGGVFSRRIAAHTETDYITRGHRDMISKARRGSNGNWAMGLENSSASAVHRESVSLVAGCTPSWREMLYTLPCPKTFIFGEQSLPDPDAAELERQGINIEIVKGAGHSMAWDNPEGLAQAIAKGIKLAS